MHFRHTVPNPEPQEEKASYNVLKPPAKIASPKFGRDVAATPSAGELRDAELQMPEVALKMSTELRSGWQRAINYENCETHI